LISTRSPPSIERLMLHRRFRALLWDNDGVLVDTEGLYFRATREVLAEVGIDLTESQYVPLFLVGNQGLEPFVEALGGRQETDRLRARRNARYSELLRTEPIGIPGAAEVLSTLAPHHRMAIVTSSSREHLALAHERTGLLRYFELLVAEGDYRRSKPHPDPYHEAVRRLQVSPEECLVIEDSRRGLLAAKAAGLTCWVVPNALSARAPLDEADSVLNNLGELPAALGLRAVGTNLDHAGRKKC
jgi:HAD superfamily hydrolase (TIGR01509 family)